MNPGAKEMGEGVGLNLEPEVARGVMKSRRYTGREGKRHHLVGWLCSLDEMPTENFQVRLAGDGRAILCRAGCADPAHCSQEGPAMRRWRREVSEHGTS